MGIIAALNYDFWRNVFSGNPFGAQAILNDPFGPTRVIIIPAFLIVISMYWVTVAWHRFVILDEQPSGILPKLHLGRIWAYIWRLLVLAIVIAIVVILPLALVANIVGVSGKISVGDYSDALARGPMAVVINLIGTAIFTYAFLRYSPFLVAAAIGRPIRATTGRESTY